MENNKIDARRSTNDLMVGGYATKGGNEGLSRLDGFFDCQSVGNLGMHSTKIKRSR